MKLEDQIRRLIALKQTAPPPPTLLEKPGSVKEGPARPMTTVCGVTYPAEYDNGVAVGAYDVSEVYEYMIPYMYCRPLPDGGCEPLHLSGTMPPQQTVTDRDLPLTWQRDHPEFNPNDPNTWGSLFGPGGWVENLIRYVHCPRDENHRPIPCHSEATIREFCDIVRQFYAVRCGFAVAQTGSCCTFPDFGGAECTQTTSSSCQGIYTAGGNCNGPNPCGLAPNLIEINDQVK